MVKRMFLPLMLVLLLAGVVRAQAAPKFGHIDTQELLTSMPEFDSAQARMKAFQKDIVEQMEQLQVEMNKKYQDYVQKREKLSPALRETKEKELQDLQARFQEFQGAAQRDLQDTEAKLMTPIQEKAKQAMQKVGKANGFFYIFDRSGGSLVYVSPESIDVLPMVQKELGIKPKKK